MPTKVLSCGSSVSNVTEFQCSANYGVINSGLLSFVENKLTYSNALLEASWTTELNKEASTRTYVFPAADDAIRNQEDPVFTEGNLSKRTQVRKGRTDIAFEYHSQRDCVNTVINTFNGQRMYFIARTENEALVGGDDGTNFVYVPVDVFTSDPIPSENKDDPWKVILYVYYVNTIGNFDKFVLPDDETYNTGTLWKPSGLEGLIDATMTEISASATEIKVHIEGNCDEREMTEAVTADFELLLVSTGATVAVTATHDGGGDYTLAGTFTLAAHTLGFKNQPDMTTKGWETQSTLSITPS